jgi:hypothetical protein
VPPGSSVHECYATNYGKYLSIAVDIPAHRPFVPPSWGELRFHP